MTLWKKCKGENHIVAIEEEPWRVVESQSSLSSRNLVDTQAEYDVLEEMIEASKPRTKKELHYLIFTPFRYPPLKYGSRFGSKFEPSLWYGSLEIKTALSEVAYYRLLFLKQTEADLQYINVSLTAFQAKIVTHSAIDLCAAPFAKYRAEISSPSNYESSQLLGSQMRENNIDAFKFYSARNEDGINIAAFNQTVFQKKKGDLIFNVNTWQCSANKKSVMFFNLVDKTKIGFEN